MGKNIIPLSHITDSQPGMDSVRELNKQSEPRYAKSILDQAHKCWDDLYNFRKYRERNKQYCFGNQWGDTITTEYGKDMTEEEYIISQGSVPLKNNLIRRLVRTVNGVWRNQNQEPTVSAVNRDEQALGETMSVTLQVNWRRNKLNNVLGRILDEFLISGIAVSKETVSWYNGSKDCYTTIPDANYLFFNGGLTDVRLWDLNLIGEIHDLQFNDLCEQFATSPAEFKRLSDIYGTLRRENYAMQDSDTLNFGNKLLTSTDFLYPSNPARCRVIEVWTKERKPRLRVHDVLNARYYVAEITERKQIDRENNDMIAEAVAQGMAIDEVPVSTYEWFIDSYWYYRFLTPDGEILKEGESPYKHREHPYTLTIYPMIDGEAHSFVADVIDQQRYVNRLITLNDWVVRSSAKGLMIYPEDALPDNMSLEEVQAEAAKPNGFMLYKPSVTNPNAVPMQLANNSTNIGISELLHLQLSLMEDITGVTGALQGKQAYSGISGSLYAQQQQQASNSLLDLLETFSAFVRDTALKKVYNIQQTYDDKRILSIVGKSGTVTYDPEQMEDVQFDLAIVDSQQTPVYRAIMNDYLMQFLQLGQIGVKELLEVGDFPFADRLLEIINQREQQMQQGQAPQQIPQDIMQQVQQQSDPKATAQAQQQLQQDEPLNIVQNS